jgi:diguanylate cyclase (GGDEF)-like protein
MAESALVKTTEPDPLQEINLRLSRSLKGAFRQNLIEAMGLVVAAAVVFWLLGASDDHIGSKLLLVTLILSILSAHCYQMMRHHECRSLVLKQLEVTAKDRVKTTRLYDLSILDPLTGLHNRRFGEQCLKEAIDRSRAGGESLAVVLIDLDYFKEINDKFGHAVGDLALKEFSRSLRKAIRACDTPVRLGGDEFMLVLPECPRDKVNVILERIGTPAIHCDGIKIHVCSSSGSAQYEYGDTSETILARADEVLYAKKAARGGSAPKLPSRLSVPALQPISGLPTRAGWTADAITRRS